MNGLSALQLRLIGLLQQLQPPPVLFGGAAILATVCAHRATRDLDLLWQPADDLVDVARQVASAIEAAGMRCDTVQRAPTFVRFRLDDGADTVLLDLVAHPGQPRADVVLANVAGQSVRVLSLQGLMVDKLGALLSREEGRDLDDLKQLLIAGGDLAQAVAAAPHHDAGFSCMVVVGLLRRWRMPVVAAAAGWSAEKTSEMEEFRDTLVDMLADLVG